MNLERKNDSGGKVFLFNINLFHEWTNTHVKNLNCRKSFLFGINNNLSETEQRYKDRFWKLLANAISSVENNSFYLDEEKETCLEKIKIAYVNFLMMQNLPVYIDEEIFRVQVKQNKNFKPLAVMIEEKWLELTS
jgi:hypothetical protein